MAKFSLKPPVKAEEFIAQATDTTQKPWEHPRVRDDVVRSFNLRLPEPYLLKLQYLSEKSSKSQQEIVRALLLPWLDEQIGNY